MFWNNVDGESTLSLSFLEASLQLNTMESPVHNIT